MKLRFIFVCLSVLVSLFIAPISNAQTATPTATTQTQTPNQQTTVNRNYLNANPDVPLNLHTYTQSVFIEIASALSCELSGVDPINPRGKCLGIDPKTNKIGFVENGAGAIGIVGSFITDTFYMPINTHEYVANMAANFGIAKQTYAQQGGLGFNSLTPTLKLWTAFRNIVYMLFVIMFVILGLGIMFRIKIDPRTVMGIQNQIPKIIIALVLVTFSYAIAGFLVDIMYVLIYLTIGIFAQAGFDVGSSVASTPFGMVGGIGGISGIASGVAFGPITSIVKDIFSGTLGTVIGAMIGAIIGKTIGGGIGGFLGQFGGVATFIGTAGGALFGGLLGNKIVGLLAGVIAYLVITIAIFSALLRLWFVLIKSYIYVLITVVFAPFYIAYGLLPGKSGIGSWVKSMLANLSVFPVTIGMFLLGKTFISGFTTSTNGVRPFTPPLIGDFTSADRMGPIIGLAIILMLPEVANIVRDTLKSPAFKYDAAIGKGLGVGAGVISAPISTIGSKVWGVDPWNKKPKPLTEFVSNKIAGGTNRLNRLIRLGLGTSTWFKEEQEKKAALAAAQERSEDKTKSDTAKTAAAARKKFLKRESGGPGTGTGTGGTTPPPTPPGTPPTGGTTPPPGTTSRPGSTITDEESEEGAPPPPAEPTPPTETPPPEPEEPTP